jgi:hypothetical protein
MDGLCWPLDSSGSVEEGVDRKVRIIYCFYTKVLPIVIVIMHVSWLRTFV